MTRLPLNHVWIFLTDRCNLRCGYCFFQGKTGRQEMSGAVLKSVLSAEPVRAGGEFVFSGGEPLTAWPLLRQTITDTQKAYPGRYLAVQSNGTLIDGKKAVFLKDRNVSVEVGIDGDEATVLANRPGSGVRFQDVLRGVGELVSAGGPLTATMTVDPAGAGDLERNVRYLAALGLRSIEVHPAFLGAWDAASSREFLSQYRRASAWELKEERAGLMGRGYSCAARGAWDMVVMPDGKVLPSWVFLSFPAAIREKFFIMDFAGGKMQTLPAAAEYFKLLARFWQQKRGLPSYRKVSNFNASLAVKMPGGEEYLSRVRHYVGLCESVERIDRTIMEKNAWQRSVMTARLLKKP